MNPDNEPLLPLVPDTSNDAGTSRIRLDFLDGIRGLCAVYIVFYHAQQIAGVDNGKLNWFFRSLRLPIQYGYYAVPIFIVLSGFCLMLPLARTVDGRFRGGVGQYLRRRTRRILPPYYFAIAVSIVIAILSSTLQRSVGGGWNVTLNSPVILGHLFLLQDLFPPLGGGLDPPTWSVATEWQIYFVFPLLLLPIWRRFGNIVTLGVALSVGLVPHFMFGLATDIGPPWYITLFTFGMIAAVLCFSNQPRYQETGQKLPWIAMANVFGVFWLICVIIHLNWNNYRWISELMVGASAVCLIAAYARLLIQGTSKPLPLGLRVLSSRWAVALGTFSYSIYLIHFPVIYAIYLILCSWHVSVTVRITALVLGSVPLAVGLSYLFHLAFERRFMSDFAKPKES